MKKTGIIVVTAIVILAVLIGVGNVFYTVPEGHVAAIYSFGKLNRIDAATGLRIKTPFVQSIRLIDVREQSKEVVQNAYTKDTQTVENLIVKINYRLDVAQLEHVIKTIGTDFVEEKIVTPNVYAITRNIIGQYTADALIAHRAEVTQSIQDQLIKRFADKGVTLVNFNILNIDFEDSFEAAVRRKVEAEQKALEVQNRTKEEEELARQQVIHAQAEADATRAKADAEAYSIEKINSQLANSPHYIDYLKITRWDGKLPVVQGGGEGLLLDVNDLSTLGQ